MSKSTLSSVVSSLVRASVGTSVLSTVPDEDLDKHVAELILKEAKQKAESYSKLGVKAYLPTGPDPNAPRPNKRFLSSIIRSTDDHNKTILRAQALAAQETKREREEQERRERRARAEEAAAAERSRRHRRRDDYDSDEWDTRRARDQQRSRPHPSVWDSDWRKRDEEFERERKHRRSRRSHRSRSGSPDSERTRDRRRKSAHKRTRSREHDRDRDSRHSERGRRKHSRKESRDDEPNHKRRRLMSPPNPEQNHTISHERSRSTSISEDQGTHRKSTVRDSALRNISTPSRSSQTPIEDDAMDALAESRRASKGKERGIDEVSSPTSPPRVRSPSPPPPPPPRRPRGRPTSSTSVRSPSVSPPPLPPAALPSKMDKYFEDSYDPRLDVAPLSIPTVPKTGLINDSEYEAWDAMLELLRQRREDKEEKKRLEKLGFDMSDKKIPTSKLKKFNEGGEAIMEIEYKKKGSVREWDLGKEGF
ncbi:hypothetical protein JVT61DRAFT_5089 [Boletus reticuloceps]|uniref:Uncharacterized protein n=1 Tax=Boletus reticuloceps TaxID=495285 RepID=A0A8I2YY66_9AGAM|nr:hypothetical protein JVT61DRAFT_5089 [Boletus reticuloceps]